MKKTVRNPEGYMDLTASEAIERATRKPRVRVCGSPRDEAADILIRSLKAMIKLAGFRLIDRIRLEDIETGKKYL